MISKKIFVDSINAIMYQLTLDRERSDSLAEACMYDNSILIYAILNMIGQYFDREELDHYCFVLDFGKVGDEYESPEELYERLIISTTNVYIGRSALSAKNTGSGSNAIGRPALGIYWNSENKI